MVLPPHKYHTVQRWRKRTHLYPFLVTGNLAHSRHTSCDAISHGITADEKAISEITGAGESPIMSSVLASLNTEFSII